LYARYNVDLSDEGLKTLKITDVKAEDARKMDKADPEQIDALLRIGSKAAAQVKVKEHFGVFAP
jgi:hypothetical protein